MICSSLYLVFSSQKLLFSLDFQELLNYDWWSFPGQVASFWWSRPCSTSVIDSSTILHYAAAANPSRLKTFSITFKGRSFDESRYIREAAHLYGTDHTEFDLSPGAELVDAIQQFAYYSDEPSADAGSLPVWFLSKMSRQQE